MRGLSETIAFMPAGQGERAEIEEPGLSPVCRAGRPVHQPAEPSTEHPPPGRAVKRDERQRSKQLFLPCPLVEDWEDAGALGGSVLLSV